jgi:hypothetical protein
MITYISLEIISMVMPKMKCKICGKINEVNPDAYNLQKKAQDSTHMIGGHRLRAHPLTCGCGGELDVVVWS